MSMPEKNKKKQIEAAAFEKKHWVRLTHACNNKCIFCLDVETQDGTFIPFAQVKKDLASGLKEGAQRVVLSGGEATIHPDFLAIVKLAKKMGYPHIQVITNGRLFFYKKFLLNAVINGLNEITFSIHSHSKMMHDRMTGVKGSFRQSMQGLRNAMAIPRLIVNIDIVINKLNYAHLRETVQYFIRKGITEFDLLQVTPFGRAWQNREALFYDAVRALPRLKEVFSLSKNQRLCIWTCRLPPVLLEGYEHLIQHPCKLHDEVKGRLQMFINYFRNNQPLYCYGERCAFCSIKDFCKDLIRLKKEKVLHSKQLPSCIGQGCILVPRNFKIVSLKSVDKSFLARFTDFYIAHRYFIKGLGCDGCVLSAKCEGAPVDFVREHGFSVLIPKTGKSNL
jgi:MoaA/NifB/PqqE/SkfB family radical SAM enzyme